MSRNSELKALCQQLVANQFEHVHDAEQALEQFEDLATPGAVLALLTDESGYQQGAKVEADAGDEARSKVRDMKLRESQLVTELKKLRPLLARTKAENKALREALTEKLIDATTLSGITLNTDSLTLGANGGICRIMADAFGQMLFEGDVENYIEAYFSSSKYPEAGQIVVTVKKEMGKTPHQLRLAAEKERDQLLAFANEMVNAAYEGGSFEGGEIQDIAVKHGLMRIEQRDDECGDACACREYGFPAECYRKSDLLSVEVSQ